MLVLHNWIQFRAVEAIIVEDRLHSFETLLPSREKFILRLDCRSRVLDAFMIVVFSFASIACLPLYRSSVEFLVVNCSVQHTN
jgi:hypothetical protein